jgi:two-component system, OmpR family, response regulator
MKILLIEDDPRTAAFIGNGLRQEGFVVDHAADGAQGMEMVLLAPYDAAVIDIMLPKLDGMTLIETRISRLREKVDRPFDRKFIHTIRGAGYVLEVRA